MKAVVIKKQGVAAIADIEPAPVRPGYIKVKTACVAVNPTDLHNTANENVGRIGGILGCDLSGYIEEIGPECKEALADGLKKCDAVWGVSHAANLSDEADGSFAEYAQCRDGYVHKIPEGMSIEEAATLGTGITSIGQTLYFTMKLPLPDSKEVESFNKPKPQYILIYGGSCATGTLAIQFAKLSGLSVITTASPQNYPLLKSLGADIVLDYTSPNISQQIKFFTSYSLHYVLDCISTPASYAIIAAALPEKENLEAVHVVTLLPADKWPRKDVKVTTTLAYTMLGKPFSKFGIEFPAMEEQYEYGVKFGRLSQRLLIEGRVKTHPVALRKGGLAGVPNGIAEHAQGKVRGVKLVYRVGECDQGAGAAEDGPAVKAPELGKNW